MAAAAAAAPASDAPIKAEASIEAADTYSSIKKETIIAPFDDQFADVEAKDKVFWQFTVPKAWREGDVVRVVLPSRLELSFLPPAGSKPSMPLAFLVPLAETLQRQSGVEKKSSGLVGGAVKLARKMSFSRQSSFGRKPRKDASSDSVGSASSSGAGSTPAAPVFMEVDLFKKEQGVSLGLSLTNVGRVHPPREGVLLARVSPDGLVGRSKKMRPGDLLHAVNGVKVATHQQAVGLLKEATGVVQCVITRPDALPDGWEAARDKAGELYYLHKAQARTASGTRADPDAAGAAPLASPDPPRRGCPRAALP